MDIVISQIHTLSTNNDSDLKKLKDFLRHEQEALKSNVHLIDQALTSLDPFRHTLGIAFLLAAQASAEVYANPRASFAYVGNFLKLADEQQVKKASIQVNAVCKNYAQMAINEGQQAMLRSLRPLCCALEKLRPNLETLTPAHTEFLRVCLKAKAYHLAERVLDQPIYDISLSTSNCPHMTPQSFLAYFHYGALVRIGMKQFDKSLQLLLVVLTCPTSCLSAIQADAYKKYVLVSLKVNGELPQLPVYASHIVNRYAKSPSYVLEIAEAFKQGDAAALERVIEEKARLIQSDNNAGLVKQVQTALQRHKLQMLTKTYLTLSLADIAREIGMEESQAAEVEELLFDMICSGEINARINQSTGNVVFQDYEDEMDVGMVAKMQDKLGQVLELAQRISEYEHQVVSSEAYIMKTAALEGDRHAAVPALGGYDFMDSQ